MNEKIKSVVASELGLPEVSDTASFDDMDSLEFVAMMVALAKEGIEIPEKKWEDINTVADLIAAAC